MKSGGWEGKNYYQLLGVSRKASRAEIRQAYRDIALVYHPDSNFFDEIVESAGLESECSGGTLFKQITAAYNTLINPKAREEYDRTLPPDLPAWNEQAPHPVLEKVYGELVSENEVSPRRSKAFGVFGKIEPPASAFSLAAHSIKPVSEIIKPAYKRSLFSRLLYALRLW